MNQKLKGVLESVLSVILYIVYIILFPLLCLLAIIFPKWFDELEPEMEADTW